jgi:hypothetical protein
MLTKEIKPYKELFPKWADINDIVSRANYIHKEEFKVRSLSLELEEKFKSKLYILYNKDYYIIAFPVKRNRLKEYYTFIIDRKYGDFSESIKIVHLDRINIYNEWYTHGLTSIVDIIKKYSDILGTDYRYVEHDCDVLQLTMHIKANQMPNLNTVVLLSKLELQTGREINIVFYGYNNAGEFSYIINLDEFGIPRIQQKSFEFTPDKLKPYLQYFPEWARNIDDLVSNVEVFYGNIELYTHKFKSVFYVICDCVEDKIQEVIYLVPRIYYKTRKQQYFPLYFDINDKNKAELIKNKNKLLYTETSIDENESEYELCYDDLHDYLNKGYSYDINHYYPKTNYDKDNYLEVMKYSCNVLQIERRIFERNFDFESDLLIKVTYDNRTINFVSNYNFFYITIGEFLDSIKDSDNTL